MKKIHCKIKYMRPSKTGKTKVWHVVDASGHYLGNIKWFGRWRCYAFHPDWETTYEQKCLRFIADHCETESTKARQGWARKKK